MPLVVVFRAPAHRVAAAALSLPALPPKGGALLRVSAPITLAALDGVCSSLICAQQKRQHHIAATNSVREHSNCGALAKMLSEVGEIRQRWLSKICLAPGLT